MTSPDANVTRRRLVRFSARFALLLALVVANIRRSSLGRRTLAIRSNERAAAAAGVNVARVKLLMFSIEFCKKIERPSLTDRGHVFGSFEIQ